MAGTALSASPPAVAQTRPSPPSSQPPQTEAPRQREKQFPLGAAWTAISVNGQAVGRDRPSLVVDDQLRGKGFSGCNNFSATAYPLREQGFVVGPIAVTKRACASDTMATERTFLVAFRGTRKWDIVNGQLILQGVAGELRFERAL